MDHTPITIAEAFSHHDFAATFDHLAEDVRWINIGGERHDGKQSVIDACTRSGDYLRRVRTTFTRFRTIAAADTVVVDSAADYLDGDDSSTVASCDIYDFVDRQLALITSYNVGIAGGANA